MPDAEAAREKINHFLRKFILFFISLFVTLFHFLKSDVTVAFYFTSYIWPARRLFYRFCLCQPYSQAQAV